MLYAHFSSKHMEQVWQLPASELWSLFISLCYQAPARRLHFVYKVLYSNINIAISNISVCVCILWKKRCSLKLWTWAPLFVFCHWICLSLGSILKTCNFLSNAIKYIFCGKIIYNYVLIEFFLVHYFIANSNLASV